MSQRTLYLINALAVITLVALNAIDFPGWPVTATGSLKAILIPAAWFIGSWYGRADTQADLRSAMNAAQGNACVQQGPAPAEKPHALLCFAHGGSPIGYEHNKKHGFVCPKCKDFREAMDFGAGDDHSAAALAQVDGAGRVEVVDQADLDPLDAERAAFALNKLFHLGMTPQGLVGEGRHRVHKVPGPSQAEIDEALHNIGLPPQNQPPRACND